MASAFTLSPSSHPPNNGLLHLKLKQLRACTPWRNNSRSALNAGHPNWKRAHIFAVGSLAHGASKAKAPDSKSGALVLCYALPPGAYDLPVKRRPWTCDFLASRYRPSFGGRPHSQPPFGARKVFRGAMADQFLPSEATNRECRLTGHAQNANQIVRGRLSWRPRHFHWHWRDGYSTCPATCRSTKKAAEYARSRTNFPLLLWPRNLV
jgi:hypothetical protein